jgi:hypothetical protein
LFESNGAMAAELIQFQRYFDYHHAANDVFEKVKKRTGIGSYQYGGPGYLVKIRFVKTQI